MCYQNDQASKYVQESHDWHDLFCEACDTVDTSDENDCCHNCYKDTNSDSWYVECIVKCNSDRVGLYHVTHESQSQNDGYGEESCKELTESTFEYVFDIVYRTADYGTVFNLTCVLSHNCFGVNRSHTEKRADPHPENGTGSTGCNSGSSSGNITGTDLCCNSGGQCLKRTETVFTFSAVQRKITEQ